MVRENKERSKKMKVKCDIVKCVYNTSCQCTAKRIEIVPNYVKTINNTVREYIECATYINKEDLPAYCQKVFFDSTFVIAMRVS